jgi:hypothetical protein
MANVDAPNGLTPIRHLTGGTIRMNEYAIDNATAAAIFSGDTVELLGTGYIKVGTATSAQILGVFAGCRYRNAAGEIVYSKYWPAAQATLGDEDAVGYVYDDPNIVFAAQTVSGTAATFNMVGAFWDLTATAGSTSTGRSNQEINVGASAQDTFRIIGLVDKPGNSWLEHAEVEVVINDHAFSKLAGVAI